MRCICEAEFCWVCLGPWEPHRTSWLVYLWVCIRIFNVYVYLHCRYNSYCYSTAAARGVQMSSRAALERYLFYYNRYKNHLRSSKVEAKVRENRRRWKEGGREGEKEKGREGERKGEMRSKHIMSFLLLLFPSSSVIRDGP